MCMADPDRVCGRLAGRPRTRSYTAAVRGSRTARSRCSCPASSVPASMPGLDDSSHADESRVALGRRPIMSPAPGREKAGYRAAW